MASDTTKLTIELSVLLKNLNSTLQGLNRVQQKLQQISQIRVNPSSQSASSQQAALTAQRLALAQQRLQLQQQRLAISTQNVTTAQGRANVAAGRLAVAQQNLATAQQRATRAGAALGPQVNAHVQAFKAAQQAAQQFNRQIAAVGNSLRSIGQGFSSLGAALSVTITAPLIALGAGVTDAAIRMDSLRRGLKAISGSSEEAAIQLDRLTDIAKLPGIGFEEAIQGSIRLQAVGFSAQEAEKALIQFSNAVALTGGSREQLEQITVQLGQMAAQSKVLATDLRPILNAAPAVAVALRNAFGTTRSEEIQELGVNSKDFIEIMIRELAKLPRAAAGAQNSFDNFRDTVFRAAASIGEVLLPTLIRLADTLGPIITGIANTFAALPRPIQSTIIVVSALAAALGPFTFIFGQLLTGVGRVVVGFAQLNALGLLPTIANFRLLGQVMIGTASLAQGAAATAAAAAVGWAALAGIVIAAVGIIAAIVTLSQKTKEQTATTDEQIATTEASLKVLRQQQGVLNKVTKETEAVANASDELKTVYNSLNKESQSRVDVLKREKDLTSALREEIGRLIVAREGEQRIQAATVATAIVDTAQQIQSLGQRIDAVISRVERLRQAREELVKTGKLPANVADPFLTSIASVGSTRQLEQIDQKIKELGSETLPDLRKQSDEATEALSRQNAQLLQLEQSTGKSTREILEQAKAYGLFKGNPEEAAKGIEVFRDAQVKLQAALSGTTEEVIRQRLELRKISGPADEAAKQRKLLIEAAIDFARENSSTIDEAKKKLDEFAQKFPEVRKAIDEERKKKPIEDFLREFTGLKKPGRDTGTSLRNAQQQLADAILQVALASSEREVEIEKDKNESLLQAAEVGQRLRLISYREYLELRAQLTAASVDKEITQQQAIVTAARARQTRLLKEAQQAGIPAAERTRRQAQAAQAEEEAIRAETKLIVLQRQRDRITSELNQSIKLAADEQLKDIRQLEIQYAELQGRIEDAMKAATVEEFREQLENLAKTQDFLNKQIEKTKQLNATATAGGLGKAEVLQQLEAARNLNQRQIDAIQNIIRQKDALADLAAAEKLVEQAKDRQKQLEDDLAFQVQFRGLKEEDAIQRRLEGERRLQASLELSRSIIEQVRDGFISLGRTPPPELKKFIDDITSELRGLGELSFTERFRLAEKEFNRLNDERLQKIADVERAVRNRDIAEAEGLLFIRRINGQYVGDLQQQLDLLKQIADASNDANLKKQAQAAGETVKDAKDRLADFNKQLRSTSIDALRSGFIDLFKSLRDNTVTAKERLLNLIDSVVDRLNEVIAENIFDDLMKSIFGDGTANQRSSIIAGIKRLFGFGGGSTTTTTATGEAAHHAADVATAHTQELAASAAAATFETGVATAGAGFSTSVIASAASFAAAVTAAAAAFSATVTASGLASGASGGLGAELGAAETGLFPAVPGGVYRVVEGGYPEAVLTTDPRHATRQLSILREYLNRTQNLWGRLKAPGLAEGGFVRADAEAALLNALSVSGRSRVIAPVSHLPSLVHAAPSLSFRNINLIDRTDMVRGHLRSAEGARDIINIISENAPEIGRRIGVRG